MAKVNMENIKPNSNKYRDREVVTVDREKVTPVIDFAKSEMKKPLGRRILELFIDVDGVDLKTYILKKVLIPGIKNTAFNIVEVLLFKESSPQYYYGDRGGYRDYSTRTSYGGRTYDSRDRRIEPDRVNYRDIVLTNANDANDLVRSIRDRIYKYGSISVGEFYSMLNLPSEYTDMNWGWTDERCIGIRRTINGGYRIDIPEAKYLRD